MAIAAVDGVGDCKVLVLHGWVLDSGVWLAARALSDVTRFTYAYVDFPGYGVARNERPAQGMDEMAQSALDAAAALGWQQFSVLGHSMGGAAALRVASLASDQVLSVAAVTPGAPAGTPLDEETYAALLAAWADPGAAIKGGLAPNIDAEDLDRLVARCRASMDQPTWDAYFANWTGCAFLDELRDLTIPVSLFCGESDPFVTPAYLDQTLRALKNGRLEVLPKSGHYPMIEAAASSVPIWETALLRTC
jgi:pimeloyl-ACP methyl ester carboxylesterase